MINNKILIINKIRKFNKNLLKNKYQYQFMVFQDKYHHPYII